MAKTQRELIFNQLRKYRKARGLKQCEAARILGFADSSLISKWERGVRLPSATQIFRLAALYRVLVDALFIDVLRTIRDEIQSLEAEVLRPQRHDG
jgi:transcriptional regulator with XRE-family HTH domain